jgi:hypothetical protein
VVDLHRHVNDQHCSSSSITGTAPTM